VKNRLTAKVSIFVLILGSTSLLNVSASERAFAAEVTASGINPSVCNQTVDVTTGVTAERLANGDCVVKFTSASITINWTVPTGVTAVNALVIGGGGGGGSRAAGGGGGGGFVEATNYSVTAGNIHTITVGAGGSGAASSSAANGSAGFASSFLRSAAGLTANGGAGGLDHLSTGRGGASGSATGTGAVSSNAGGAQKGSGNCAGNWCGGGGGGAGAVGADAVTTGGAGGDGRSSSITGAPIAYAGGGGGGSGSSSNTPTPGGAGGAGGGGAGTTSTQSSCVPQNGVSGTANLGGGGGGAGYCITPNTQGTGGSGGSGVVIISYAPYFAAPTFAVFQLAGGATIASYRTAIVITATVNVASRITFRVNGKALPGCKNKTTTVSGSDYTATCSWRPSNRGPVALTALAAPTGAGISSSTAPQLNIRVGNRTGPR
jgi:hypothetical protein